MNPTFKRKLRYRFEQFLAKGGTSIFVSLLVAFLISFGTLILVRALLLLIFGDPGQYNTIDSFWEHIWYLFLQMTDPGNMYQDSMAPGFVRVSTILAGFVGVILLSMLIAFITTALEKTLYEFRKGRGPVLEKEHTLILGWNERVVDIIRELIIANESEDYASIVVLADEDKEKMDDLIVKRITDSQTTKIITSSGDPSNLNELKRVSAEDAKSIIVLATCSDSATEQEKLLSDTQGIKTIMALIACQGGDNSLPIVIEVFNHEKRDIVNFFNDENIIALDSWDIMGKLLVQTSLTSGLEMVYNEILSFDGSEIYFYEADWNGTMFYDLPYHFKDGIPLGIHKTDGTLLLRPEEDIALEDGDEILILAEDDSTINFEASRVFTPQEIEFADKKIEQTTKNVLILGWHSVAEIFISECDDYLLPGSKFDVMMEDVSEDMQRRINELDAEYPDLNISLHRTSALSLDNLKEMKPYSYHNVIILSQYCDEQPEDKIDSDTLMILLLLRRIAHEENINLEESDTKLITQVLNSENQDLIIQTDVDDFIISNKLITMILAQLSEETRVKKLYDDIFQEDGSEIYVKPARLYFTQFPIELTFADVIGVANKREEICLGVRYGDKSMKPEENFGVILNLPKDEKITLKETDFLVVLAEDEL